MNYVGIATQQLLVISNGGHVTDVVTEDKRPFLKLPGTFLGIEKHETPYLHVGRLNKIFGSVYKNYIYFINTNPNGLVTRFDLRIGVHRTVDNSNIINFHHNTMTGVQVGDRFWVIGGVLVEPQNPWGAQKQTSLFSLKKEKWFDGPNLPSFIVPQKAKDMCVLAVDFYNVMFFDRSFTYNYNFKTQEWSRLVNFTVSLQSPTCTIVQTKDYKRLATLCFFTTFYKILIHFNGVFSSRHIYFIGLASNEIDLRGSTFNLDDKTWSLNIFLFGLKYECGKICILN